MCWCNYVSVWRPPPLSGYILIRAVLSQSPCGHEYSGAEAATLPAARGALAGGSPERTPCYLSIWALSAPPTPRTRGGRWADLHVHAATPTGAASSHVQQYLLAGPSVWGRKSQCGLAGAAGLGAAGPLLKQWEPTLIGKTQQERGWRRSQEGQGKLSQRFSHGRLLEREHTGANTRGKRIRGRRRCRRCRRSYLRRQKHKTPFNTSEVGVFSALNCLQNNTRPY